MLRFDAIRLMIGDHEADAGADEAAWGALLELAARRMGLGRLTAIDADFSTRERRRPLLDLAAEHHPTVTEPLWLNQTVNPDTGAAAEGGRITALRYPEMETVSVAVGRAAAEQRWAAAR